MEWHVRAEGQQLGPLSEQDLLSWARAGRLKAVDLVWRAGMPQWLPAGQAPELASVLGAFSGPAPASVGDDPLMRALLPVGRSGWAIAAGYLGLVSILVLPAPFALLCGLLAVRAIRRNPKKHGMGRAAFGIIMGALGTVALVWIVVASLK